jgi:hypothetical protein
MPESVFLRLQPRRPTLGGSAIAAITVCSLLVSALVCASSEASEAPQAASPPRPIVAVPPPPPPPRDSVNVASYGAKGDGVSDDTAAITLAIANTPRGKTLYFPTPTSSYLVAGSLNIAQPMTVLGSSSTVKMNSADTNLFNVTSSNVTIRGMIMQGADQSGGIAVSLGEGVALRNVNVIGNTIDDWFGGILLENVESFKVKNNRLTNLNAYGIDTYPASHGDIDSNFVQYVSANNSDGNGYGILLSGNTRSDNIHITNNDVEDIPNWECYDTHGGSNLTFHGDYCRNAKVGFNIVWNGSNSPLNVTVDHNTVVYGGGTSWGAIVFGGSDQPGAALGTGSITNNTLVGYNSLQIFTSRAKVKVSGNVLHE